MNKKTIGFFIVVFMIILSFNVSFATEAGNDDAIIDIDGDTTKPAGDTHEAEAGKWSAMTTGTHWEVRYKDAKGIWHTTSLNYEDGAGEGPVGGYGSWGDYNGVPADRRQVPGGTLEVTPEDLEAALRRAGKTEIADAIKNGADYDLYASQMIYAKDPDGTEYKWYTLSQLQELAKTNPSILTDDLYTVYNNALKAWYDEAEGLVTKAHYSRRTPKITSTTTITITPPTTNTSTPENSSETTTSPDTSSSPEPSTPTPKPPIEVGDPSITYVLEYVGDANCERAGEVKTELGITNDYFGVSPIPTSEDIKLVGSTNYLADLKNVQKWQLKITEANNIWLYVQYISKVTESKYWVTWKKNKSGDWVLDRYDLVSQNNIHPHTYINSDMEDYQTPVGVNGYDIFYDIELDELEPEDISRRIIGDTIGYIYTGDAYITSNSIIEIYNEVFLQNETKRIMISTRWSSRNSGRR